METIKKGDYNVKSQFRLNEWVDSSLYNNPDQPFPTQISLHLIMITLFMVPSTHILI